MSAVDRLSTRPLFVFAMLSLSVHVAVFVVAGRPANAPPPLAFDGRAQTLAGETLDIEPRSPAVPNDEDPDVSTTTTTMTTTPTANSNSHRLAHSLGRPSASALSSARPSPAAADPPPLYGAAGVRFATDLATTFTRTFAQAASADSAWSSVAFGAAGRAALTLQLDGDGHLTSAAIDGSPSPALRRSIERTIALLEPRAFTARGAITKLRITAHVSRDDLHDGFHGDVFALSAGSFTGDVGSAFFALPPGDGPGRRIDVEVRLLP
jgi:hypothetical protein